MVLVDIGTFICPVEFRRGARVVESGGLEIRCAALRYRGFESHPLRSHVTGAIGEMVGVVGPVWLSIDTSSWRDDRVA